MLTFERPFVDTYTMLPAVVLSLKTKVLALGTGMGVYKSMLKPGGNAMVSSGKLRFCAELWTDKTHRHVQNRMDADLLLNMLAGQTYGCSVFSNREDDRSVLILACDAASALLAVRLRSGVL